MIKLLKDSLLDQVDQEYIRINPRTEKILFTLFLLLSLMLLYWTHQFQNEAKETYRRYKKFTAHLQAFTRLQNQRSKNFSEKTEAGTSPLSYLESTVNDLPINQERRIVNLTPSGTTREGKKMYRIEFNSTRIQHLLLFLRQIEIEQVLAVRGMSLDRVAPSVSRFDATFDLVEPAYTHNFRRTEIY